MPEDWVYTARKLLSGLNVLVGPGSLHERVRGAILARDALRTEHVPRELREPWEELLHFEEKVQCGPVDPEVDQRVAQLFLDLFDRVMQGPR